MLDRVPRKKNQYRITEGDGASRLVTITRADDPTQIGTPLNKKTFLSAKVEGQMGLIETSTVSDALDLLYQGNINDLRVVELQSSGTWTAPDNIVDNKVVAFVFAAGGGGGFSKSVSGGYNGGGGGGGGGLSFGTINVTPNKVYNVVIGAGGKGATSSAPATDGGASWIEKYLFATGGKAGKSATSTAAGNGGDGGTGGGGGFCQSTSRSHGKGGNANIPRGGYGGGGGSPVKGGNGGKYGGGGAGKGGVAPGTSGTQSGIPLFNFPSLLFTPQTPSFQAVSTLSGAAKPGYGGNGGLGYAGGGGGFGAAGGNEFSGGGAGGGGFFGRGHDGAGTAGGGGGGFKESYAYGGDAGKDGVNGFNGGNGVIILIYSTKRSGGSILDGKV